MEYKILKGNTKNIRVFTQILQGKKVQCPPNVVEEKNPTCNFKINII